MLEHFLDCRSSALRAFKESHLFFPYCTDTISKLQLTGSWRKEGPHSLLFGLNHIVSNLSLCIFVMDLPYSLTWFQHSQERERVARFEGQ